jgi:hypothetical protein
MIDFGNHRRRLAMALLAAPWIAGCYNAEALRKERQEANAVVRLEEIDLGEFRVTLPHVLGNATDSIVDFHAFGHVRRREREEVAQVLQSRGPELRSRMLLSIRGMSESDFEEPKLARLREEIASVMNAALNQKLIKKVGFYSFELTRMQ